MLGKQVEVGSAARARRYGRYLRPLAILALCTLVVAPASQGQKADKFSRKLIYRENPSYPLTLREAHIGGVVRLEIVISPKGTVDQISPLGGNPVLVEAAATAVRKWKYSPADSESKTEVEFTFDPRR